MFEQEFDKLLHSQQSLATGTRLEQLQKNLVGEKKLLEVVVWPVLKSFDGIILEHEIISTTGVKIYIDVFYEPLELGFESEGFVVHAEGITRDFRANANSNHSIVRLQICTLHMGRAR